MDFNDCFSDAQKVELDKIINLIMDDIFPMGEVDIARDCQRIDNITKHKIPQDMLTSFVISCKTFLHISNSEDEIGFVDYYLRRATGYITESEAYEIYVYFEGEAAYLDRLNHMYKQNGKDAKDFPDKFFDEIKEAFANGTYNDMIEGGHGEFGLVSSNPVPTISIRCSGRYLAKLRYNGQPVEVDRAYSVMKDIGYIDCYVLSLNNEEISRVFISPYHKRNSRIAPRGFTLAEG